MLTINGDVHKMPCLITSVNYWLDLFYSKLLFHHLLKSWLKHHNKINLKLSKNDKIFIAFLKIIHMQFVLGYLCKIVHDRNEFFIGNIRITYQKSSYHIWRISKGFHQCTMSWEICEWNKSYSYSRDQRFISK